MKTPLALLCSIFSFSLLIGITNFTHAYTPTATDTQQLTSIKNILTTTSTSDLWNYYQQFAKLRKSVNTYDEKLDYFLTHLRDYAYSQLGIQKNLAKQQSKDQKMTFLQTYQPFITLNETLHTNCL
jgi:hypothetical protein